MQTENDPDWLEPEIHGYFTTHQRKRSWGQIIPRLFHHKMATPQFDICKSVAEKLQVELKC